jgi:tRNA (guanine10-N2)-methyltransferase
MNGLNKSDVYSPKDYHPSLPYLIVNFEKEEDAVAVCSRGILIKSIMELYMDSPSYEQLEQDFEKVLSDNVLLPYKDNSWSITVAAFGKSLSLARQSEIRQYFKRAPFHGEVKCRDPEQLFWCLEQHTPPIPGQPVKENSEPDKIYFGREVATSERKKLLKTCNLKSRAYLGPTSMDNELSLVMANMGLVRKGSVVLDPFVGTGSILVACANFGAFCFGTDIDTLVLRGKQGKNLFSNFEQYNLPKPEIIRCDASMYSRQFRHTCMYDAIVCDPPYGIRAGARKSGSRKETFNVVPEELRTSHIPKTQPYPVVVYLYISCF